MTSSQYVSMLERIGFVDIKLQSIEEHVFPGFISFIDEHYKNFSWLIRPQKWLKFIITSKILSYVWSNKCMRYVIVTAKKSNKNK